MEDQGFIVHSFTHQKKPYLYMIGRLATGESFGIVETRSLPLLYIRENDYDSVLLLNGVTADSKTDYKTMDGDTLVQLSCLDSSTREKQNEVFLQRGIRTYAGDIPFIQQYRIMRKIHGSISIKGDFKAGEKVGRLYMNPEIRACDYFPGLVVLSIDIETDINGGIRAIGLSGKNPYRDMILHKVLLLSNSIQKDSIEHHLIFNNNRGSMYDCSFIRCCSNEKMLLTCFTEEIVLFDPDIITGWNVIDFDFAMITARFRYYHLPLSWGRSSQSCRFIADTGQKRNAIIIPGRQVIDAMWLFRFSPDRYPDYKLETIAQILLGEGKDIKEDGREKVAILDSLYREDPGAFAAYCLKDAVLVLKILEKTGLMQLTVKRALLTGVHLEWSWTSIRTFENLYMEKLLSQGIVSPTRGVDERPVQGAAGGLILAPQSDLFENVYVFDFKSLYPSIILTFNIDPASFMFQDTETGANENSRLYIKAPNGACFSRTKGILPAIVGNFFSGREQAKQDGDKIASYVYKILMNSFYGVLGTRGCRFASDLFAGAITEFGHELLLWCSTFLSKKGYRVIYGDTDSLFVQSGHPGSVSFRLLHKEGKELADMVNSELSRHIDTSYNVESRLELEFEKIYELFFIPPIRADRDHKNQGRSKGYAGYILTDEKDRQPESLLEIKGMEAIRSDWTALAQDFQIRLFILVFTRTLPEEISGYICRIKHDLLAGKYDHVLVYTKTIRRPVISYTRTKPPQVKVAEKLGWKHERGKVSYYMTINGPEPVSQRTSPVDYQHYIDKQLKPIAYSLEKILHLDIDALFRDDSQPWLF
ncbi:MAG: DNA polymerase II [Spirochaetales bacterium]|nr:DNA polymerase II [Spirochaetales bacterium]